tara:strand:+ start:343 stop:891 length:549 start_codon:yes stop_codon:yes gene_type:complete
MNDVLIKAENLLKAIEDNSWTLWESSLEDTADCVLLHGGNYETEENEETGEFDKVEKTGIADAFNSLKDAIDRAKGVKIPVEFPHSLASSKVEVRHFTGQTGRPIPNQYMLYLDDCVVFQSYKSVIAKKFNDGSVLLDRKYWCWSNTTGKYRNIFLGEDMRATEKKIKSGEYRLTDLNGEHI